jgi:hypothetical protein
MAVAVQDDTVYLGRGPRIVILDVSDPTSPRLVGQSDVLDGVVQDIVVLEGLAYIAAADAGLRVVDIADPVRPREVGFLPTAKDANRLLVDGDFAYLLTSICEREFCEGQLLVVDVSDAHRPYVSGSVLMSRGANGLALAEGYVYVAHETGLDVVDVSNPTNPHSVGSLRFPSAVEDVALAGGYA